MENISEIILTEIENFKWTPGDVQCLIHNFSENTVMFDRYSKKKVWNDVAEEVSKVRNKKFTAEQCIGKWKGLKLMYKKIKDHNNRSGNSHKRWEFFEAMDIILNHRPEINPPATCSSDEHSVSINNPVVIAGTTSEDFNFNDIIEITPTITPPSALQRKRRAMEDEKNKRHEDKMQRADKFLALFEKLIDKI